MYHQYRPQTRCSPPLKLYRRIRQILQRRHSTVTDRVTSIVFTDARSDSTHARHRLLCPLLTTMHNYIAGQNEWTFALETRPPVHSSTNPPLWTLTQKALIGTVSGKDRDRSTETAWAHHESMSWRVTDAETVLFIMQRWMKMRIRDDAPWMSI